MDRVRQAASGQIARGKRARSVLLLSGGRSKTPRALARGRVPGETQGISTAPLLLRRQLFALATLP